VREYNPTDDKPGKRHARKSEVNRYRSAGVFVHILRFRFPMAQISANATTGSGELRHSSHAPRPADRALSSPPTCADRDRPRRNVPPIRRISRTVCRGRTGTKKRKIFFWVIVPFWNLPDMDFSELARPVPARQPEEAAKTGRSGSGMPGAPRAAFAVCGCRKARFRVSSR